MFFPIPINFNFQSFCADFELWLVSSLLSHSILFMFCWFLGVKRSYIVPYVNCTEVIRYMHWYRWMIYGGKSLSLILSKPIKSLFCIVSVYCWLLTHLHSTRTHSQIGFRHLLSIRLIQSVHIIRESQTLVWNTHILKPWLFPIYASVDIIFAVTFIAWNNKVKLI